MSEAFKQLLTDPTVWGFIVAVGLAGAALVRSYMERRITTGVDHRFAVMLEDHKQSLHLAAESARYHFERELAQANLYTSRAHAAAVEVHQAMRVAHGSCLSLRGIQVGLTFDEFNFKDLSEHMTAKQVPKGKQEEILRRIGTGDRPGAITELQKYLSMVNVQSADLDLKKAQNAAYLNELYFDDATIAAIDRFFGVMNEWMAFMLDPPDTQEERAQMPTKKQATEALEAVHTIFRDRLSGSGEGGLLEKPTEG